MCIRDSRITINKFKISFLQQLVDSGVILSIDTDTSGLPEGNTGTTNTVSYTHLDVYKRQLQRGTTSGLKISVLTS